MGAVNGVTLTRPRRQAPPAPASRLMRRLDLLLLAHECWLRRYGPPTDGYGRLIHGRIDALKLAMGEGKGG
jgi:hypothetical protein